MSLKASNNSISKTAMLSATGSKKITINLRASGLFVAKTDETKIKSLQQTMLMNAAK